MFFRSLAKFILGLVDVSVSLNGDLLTIRFYVGGKLVWEYVIDLVKEQVTHAKKAA